MYVRLKDLFKKWTKPDANTVEVIMEVIIMEQLVDMMPPGLQIWFREHRPKTGVEAAELAADYFDARKGIPNDFQRRPQTYHERPPVVSNDKEEDKKANNQQKNSNMLPWRHRSGPPIRSRGCNQQGYIERFCPKAKRMGYLSKRNDKCPYKDFIIPSQIDGQRVEIVLDLGCDMTLVHSDLVDPKNINHRERMLNIICVTVA